MYMYVFECPSYIFIIIVHSRDSLQKVPYCYVVQAILDLHGCSLHCCTMADSTQENQFVIARPDVSTTESQFCMTECALVK